VLGEREVVRLGGPVWSGVVGRHAPVHGRGPCGRTVRRPTMTEEHR
jgi:hypothetical protein